MVMRINVRDKKGKVVDSIKVTMEDLKRFEEQEKIKRWADKRNKKTQR